MLADPFENIVEQVGKVVLGKKEQIRLALACLFARGHLLIEDIPGIGKTTLAKALSISLGLEFQRIQCTSDMLPGDILGVSVFEQKSGSFTFHKGPVFTQVLLADEINRATPKTQSALLEAMEEHQVTVEGQTRPLHDPFFVIATQNPLEHSGTYPLPESQLDRFLMRIELGYPGREAERRLLKGESTKKTLSEMNTNLTRDDVKSMQENIGTVFVSDSLLEYLQDLLEFTRTAPHFHVGLSPRAGLGVLQTAKSWAFLHGRDHVLPEDIQAVFYWVVSHRVSSSEDLRGFPKEMFDTLFQEVAVP
ncbi:MAG: MoxR family ATPase [Desulfobacteraceae bacterium]|nr:MAG: MoxR family ATPase [Desulfobacteraceae bacterium]